MMFKVIINGGKDRKRMEIKYQDINQFKAEICRRLEIESDIKLMAKVRDNGELEEYSISSSSDLQNLWEDIAELHVTVAAANRLTGELTVDVVFNNDERKLFNFKTRDLHDIRSAVCERFEIDDERPITLLAICEGSQNRYSISSNDDIQELWNRIAELHVEGKMKRLDINMKVIINGEELMVDSTPDPKSNIVQEMMRVYGTTDTMTGVEECFERMGDMTLIAYCAAVGTGNVDLQLETKDLGFQNIRICQKAKLTVQTYIDACSSINETFGTVICYLLRDNDFERAFKLMSSLGGEAKKCKDQTEGLINAIDRVAKTKVLSKSRSEMVTKKINNAFKQRECAQEDTDTKQFELEHVASRITNALRGTIRNVAITAGATALGVAGVVGGVSATGAACAVLAAKTVAVGAIATAAAPAFLLGGAAMTIAGFLFKKNADSARVLEQMLEEHRKRRLQLKTELQRLEREIENSKSNEMCFHLLRGELLRMKSNLEQMRGFFEELLKFCEAVKVSEDRIEGILGSGTDFTELIQTNGFKMQVVSYQAKWVAIKEVCLGCRDTLGKTKKELHDNIVKNPTKDEARAEIRAMIENMSRKLN